MTNDKPKHCVITGAGAGIGRALAVCFANNKYAITIIDLNADAAYETEKILKDSGATVYTIIADLAQEVDRKHIFKCLSNQSAIDVFIHNAGISAVGPFSSTPLTQQQAVLQVNFLAPLLLTANLLQQNLVQTNGSLVFMSSLSHFVSYPGATVYAATKDGLSSYARSLNIALAKQNIHTLTVYPGPTRTDHARRYSPDNSREHKRMLPDQLAKQIFKAVQTRQVRLVSGMGNKLFAIFGYYFPRLAEWTMKKTLFNKIQ